MDGSWQIRARSSRHQYAIRAQQAAKMMKSTDPTIKLVACGKELKYLCATLSDRELNLLLVVSPTGPYIGNPHKSLNI